MLHDQELVKDICQAHWQIWNDYNLGGPNRLLPERLGNLRRNENTDAQLHRIGFSVPTGWCGYDCLSERGKEIYQNLVLKYGFSMNGDTFDFEYMIDAA